MVMTLSNIDRAATIKALAAEADQISRQGLEKYRQIGEELNTEKAVQGHGKFLSWFEEQGFDFTIRWGQLLMKLASRWDDIETAKTNSGSHLNGVRESLALLRPKPIQPKDAERVLKLAEVSADHHGCGMKRVGEAFGGAC